MVGIAICLAAQIAKGLYVIAVQENALLGAKKGGEEKNAIENAMLDVMVKTVKKCAVIALKAKSVIICLETVLKDVNQGTEGLLAKKSAKEVFMVQTVREYATQLVIAVIKSREFVKMVASQDGKATFVKASVIIISTEAIAALDVGIALAISNVITLMVPA